LSMLSKKPNDSYFASSYIDDVDEESSRLPFSRSCENENKDTSSR
jgi:hypothetical protein